MNGRQSLSSKPRRTLEPTQQARLVLLVSLVTTLLLYIVPHGRYLAYPLMLLSTLAHEMGHGVTAMLLGQSFERFEMWSDGSGVAYWSGQIGRFRMAMVAAGGLIGPAVVAAIAFVSGRQGRHARRTLAVGAIFLAVALVWVVRNLFAGLFVTSLLLICFWIAAKGSDELAQLVLVFFAVQLALSVFSRGDYLFTPVAETAQGAMPSDVGQMAMALWLPYWFWGAVCGGISVLVLIFGLRVYWR